jgi:hypothetical protein
VGQGVEHVGDPIDDLTADAAELARAHFQRRAPEPESILTIV